MKILITLILLTSFTVMAQKKVVNKKAKVQLNEPKTKLEKQQVNPLAIITNPVYPVGLSCRSAGYPAFKCCQDSPVIIQNCLVILLSI